MSSKYQLLDFALKSPIIIVKKGLLVDSASRFISRFDFMLKNDLAFDWKIYRAG